MKPTTPEHKLILKRKRWKRWYDTHLEEQKLRQKRWYEDNKSYFPTWRSNNRQRVNQYAKNWRTRNPDKVKAARLQKSVNHQLADVLRRRINNTLLKNTGKRQSLTCLANRLLGCRTSDFRIYLESKFESGMTWENYGKVWHIDHIMPCAIFDLTKHDHQHRCFHFSNMQPMFASENLKKRDCITDPQFRLTLGLELLRRHSNA